MRNERMFATVTMVERIEVDGHLLTWDVGAAGATLTVAPALGPSRPAARPTVFRLTAIEGRMRLGLALLPTDRVIDVSHQPALLTQVLPVGLGPCAPGSAGATVARWIGDLAGVMGAWRHCDPAVIGLVGTVGGAALPLLGAAYAAGAAPVGEVPRWAVDVLAEAAPASAARVGFGPRATRPVARALAKGLVASPPPTPEDVANLGGAPGATTGSLALFRLAIAMMAASVVEPDCLARLLVAPGPPHGPDRWPDVEGLHAGRMVMAALGPNVATQVLLDAAATEQGPRLLDELLSDFGAVGDLLPARVATRLVDLHRQCRVLMPIDPNPEASRSNRGMGAPREPAPAHGQPEPEAQPRTEPRAQLRTRGQNRPQAPTAQRPDARRRALRPPRVARTRTAPDGVFRYSSEVSRLHQMDAGPGMRLVLPRSPAELSVWGHRLRNCIGSYGEAVAAERSLLVGVEMIGELRFCLEVSPTGAVRQFLGDRNRMVPDHVATPVCRVLAAAGILDAGSHDNQIWLGA